MHLWGLYRGQRDPFDGKSSLTRRSCGARFHFPKGSLSAGRWRPALLPPAAVSKDGYLNATVYPDARFEPRVAVEVVYKIEAANRPRRAPFFDARRARPPGALAKG